MKNILLLIYCFALLGLTNKIINAQSLEGVKICVNPGHGGYDSNDRFIVETGFWESEGNLGKGLQLKSILENLGADIVITRTENKTSDDLPLSQIVEIANANNVDYFHSIHSNASGTVARNANYTLILYQGTTVSPTYPGSRTMANHLVDEIFKANRTTDKRVFGDFDFYGTGKAYLGVFKGLNMPGTLSEGSFHDYIPESFRLKNDSYLKHEAWAIARGFLKYFNAGEFQTGIAAGLVKSAFESVPASYNALLSLNDNLKPINQVKVTLEPGGLVYNGDDDNNGFYFFDSLQPGDYKLYIEAENYTSDSAEVTVVANESRFADVQLSLLPNPDPPSVVDFSPADGSTDVSNVESITVDFDIIMNTQSAQNAFAVIPSVTGSFAWENNNKRLIFTPSTSYTAGTEYTVFIASSATSQFGVNLIADKSFNFTTRSELKLKSTYPEQGDLNIPTTVFIKLIFDEGIVASSLSGRISLTDPSGNNVSVKVDQSRYGEGIIGFEPLVPLQINSVYKINIKEGIKDIENVTLLQDYTIEFTTALGKEVTGNILNDFESGSSWGDPSSASNTQGVNNSNTGFTITTLQQYSGSSSGKLEYEFTGSGGNVELPLNNSIDLGESGDQKFGMWVFGDNSRNILKYKFSRSSEIYYLAADTINWTGWDFKEISLNGVAGSGSIEFAAVEIEQKSGSDITGKLYFDDIISQAQIVTDINDFDNLPSDYSLEQNYPNPFNPSTAIRFSIPREELVQVKIYNTIGQKMLTLLNEVRSPGTHEIIFNADDFSSGIYFYKITAGKFVKTKKMLLIK